ncbi:MAG TPA: DNA repair protein RecN [Bacillota bacterium]|jgi:DNA repair protein RecN (Recombination protein N)|nr:DNA repair protein RecN [Peptococcaceae bacterium MAG4]NLW38882.1 DNA repair protein RecN [Peptococcaceae bacterium]HPZ42505.1 DNA repair protein RecN [Bacillota bacterium]HQD75297.1 DNA repair protein RecN [Bacillota bacterium]HUM57732.1 DNA repair protein RecN [Bacillota bacterium]
MLLSLFIRNFGIIELLNMDLDRGLNVLTGETGAGKSIIIEALQLALGGRASSEQIRSGTEKAMVQATFSVDSLPSLNTLLEKQGIEASGDGILLLSREIARSGKNICRINGQVVTLGFYKNVGRYLADLHVQHEQNSLLDQERQRKLLDRFGGKEMQKHLEEVQSVFNKWKSARLRFEKISKTAKERARRQETLRYEIGEISSANLKPGEEEELLAEKSMLANAEKICQLATEAYALLYDSGGGQAAATDLLARAIAAVRNLSSLDERTGSILATLENALYQVEDAAREISSYRDRAEYNPARLEAVEERLDRIKRLKKKYGNSISDVLDYLDSAGKELQFLENLEEELEDAERQLADLEAAYSRAAAKLSAARRKAAKQLEEAMTRELSSLELGRMIFNLDFCELTKPSEYGLEQIDFLISPNPGEPLKPLAKIASGGELSRIMLALKVLLAEADDVPLLVFDEVDTGIGGRALHAVAKKLSLLGKHRQVICVTHSAQVASHARAHHRIIKEFDGERTITRVELLDPAERLEELSRMLGGKDITDITRQHASQLLRSAAKH